MDPDIAASLTTLQGELDRLRRLRDVRQSPIGNALDQAVRHLEWAIDAMTAKPAKSRPNLADRLTTISPPAAEPFRTKVKLKAPEAPAPRPAQPAASELSRVRGIDPPMAARLDELGVRKLADIAAWSSDDVNRIATALDLGRRISRQNWIEQAAVLARQVPGVEAPVDPAPVAGPGVARDAPPPDDLELIAGIDAGSALILREHGVARWSDIARWRRIDIDRFQALLPPASRISAQCWIEQAAMLAAGQSTAYARRRRSGGLVLVPMPPAPEPAGLEPLPVVPSAPPDPAEAAPSAGEGGATHASGHSSAPQVSSAVAADEPDIVSEPIAADPPPHALAEAGYQGKDIAIAAAGVGIAREAEEPAVLSSVDAEFPELHVSEADVTIVRRPAARVGAAPAARPDARALLSRMRSSEADPAAVDGRNYAGYRDAIEEASVDIVEPSRRPEAIPMPGPPRPYGLRRLFKRGEGRGKS